MFFGPTVQYLRSEGADLHLLSLSTGEGALLPSACLGNIAGPKRSVLQETLLAWAPRGSRSCRRPAESCRCSTAAHWTSRSCRTATPGETSKWPLQSPPSLRPCSLTRRAPKPAARWMSAMRARGCCLQVVTFDSRGVSAHTNHLALHQGVR